MKVSRGDWVLVNYDNVKFLGEIICIVARKLPQKEEKILFNRSQIFRKLKLPEVAGSWGHFIFKDI